MWQIEYTQEASNYAIDSHPYNEDVLIAIEDLADSATGLPATDCRQLEPNLFIWEIANHLVIFRRHELTRAIRIAAIKPL